MQKKALLAVEGSHDQAAVGKLLRLFGLKNFNGQHRLLDSFWEKFIPQYPKAGNLYARMDMPSIFYSQTLSVAIYQGGGSELRQNLEATLINHPPYYEEIDAFGIIVDTDTKSVENIVSNFVNALRVFFEHIPEKSGVISSGLPRTGIYVLPDNLNPGTLDTILIKCAELIYPDHKVNAEHFLNSLDSIHREHWRPFDKQKAMVAAITSVLKPGATNTASIAQNDWICEQSTKEVRELSLLVKFIRDLLDLHL